MAPKAKVKAKARARQPRHFVGAPRGPQAGLIARNAARRAAALAGPGAWHECPHCGAARRIADAEMNKRFQCFLGRVQLGDGTFATCKFNTQARNWRMRPNLPDDRTQLRTQAVRDVVLQVHGRIEAGH